MPIETDPLEPDDDARYAVIMDAMPPMFAAIRTLLGIVCPARKLDTATAVLNFADHLAMQARQALETIRKGND